MADRRLPDIQNGALEGLKALVIGAGPLGLMSALALAQNGAKVIHRHRNLLGDGVGFENAAGLIEPVATADARAARWTGDTDSFCHWALEDPDWGIVARRVLLLSDSAEAVSGGWLDELGAVPAAPADLVGGRTHGCWFDSHVIQPDLSKKAFQREIDAFAITGGLPSPARRTFERVRDVADVAAAHNADFYVLAPGLDIANFRDIHALVGEAAGISAGLGMTIEFDPRQFDTPLDHVIMDQDDLGYLIPQKTRIVGGGTNLETTHNDPIVEHRHPYLDVDLEAEVRNKIALIWPAAADLKGTVKLGARPMRREVLTHWTEDFDPHGVILGGAGGSGWTFSVGIAHDVCRVIRRRFGLGDSPLYTLGDARPF